MPPEPPDDHVLPATGVDGTAVLLAIALLATGAAAAIAGWRRRRAS